MEVNRTEANLQNSRNTIEIPEREYNFHNMLELFKSKETINYKVTDKKPPLIQENKKENKVVKQTNSPMTLDLTQNKINDPNRYKPSDGLSDDQFLKEMFGGLAQELEGFGPACREFISIFKKLSALRKDNNWIHNTEEMVLRFLQNV